MVSGHLVTPTGDGVQNVVGVVGGGGGVNAEVDAFAEEFGTRYRD